MAANNRARLQMGRRDPWSPHVLTRSVLRGFWHADDHGTLLMTDDGGGLTSAWKDLINLVNPVAATTERPTWGATAWDGSRSAETFDGIANAMTAGTITALPTGAAPGHIFAVANATVTDGAIAGYGGAGGVNPGRRLFAGSTTDGLAGVFFVDDTTTTRVVGPAGSAIGRHVFEGWWDVNSLGGSWDGLDLGSVATATLATATTRLRLGSNLASSTSRFFPGTLRAVIVTRLLSAADRQRMQGWLAWNSGLQAQLPAEHPYRNAAP